jgi:hypothetical protein
MTEKYFLELHFDFVGTLRTRENRRRVFYSYSNGYLFFENKVVTDEGYVEYRLSYNVEILEDFLEEL